MYVFEKVEDYLPSTAPIHPAGVTYELGDLATGVCIVHSTFLDGKYIVTKGNLIIFA